MKIKSILSALLLMASTVASAQYLNVKLEDGTIRSFKTTPNMKVSFGVAMQGTEQSEQIFHVNGHQVTVKLADDTPASDVMMTTYVESGIIKIKAVSAGGYGLDCSRDDNVAVSESAVSNGFFTFTLSNIQKDMVVTIGYITVKFDMKGHGEAIKETIVKYGKNIQAPPTPTAANSAFWCWCTDADCTTLYDFSKEVKADMTLYAKWTGSINGHAYVELAGYKWATENVGKCSVTALAGPDLAYNNWGAYFYQQNNASSAAQSWGSESDASQVIYSWTLPSNKQWNDLINNCYWEWTNSYNYLTSPYNRKPGFIVYQAKSEEDKGQHDKKESGYAPTTNPHIFLPAAGYIEYFGVSEMHVTNQGVNCYYNTEDYMCVFKFGKDYRGMIGYFDPDHGSTVRPIAVLQDD